MYEYKRKDGIWYRIEDVVARYDCLLYFLCGARGIGKTFSTKRFCMNEFKTRGKQFIYLRRYQDDFNVLGNFFDDFDKVAPDEREGWSVKQNKFYYNDKVAGYAMSLTRAQKKGMEFPDVEYIIFDEFIIDPKRTRSYYLPNEIDAFNEFYVTVNRWFRDVKVFFLSNAISCYNPYFLYFDIYYGGNEFFRLKDKPDIVVQFAKSEHFAEEVRKTRVGALYAGTSYGDYAIDNEFLLDNNDRIKKKNGRCVCVANVAIDGRVYGIWKDERGNRIYFSMDSDEKCDTFAVGENEMTGKRYTARAFKSSSIYGSFIIGYDYGYLFFDDAKARAACMKFIKAIGNF